MHLVLVAVLLTLSFVQAIDFGHWDAPAEARKDFAGAGMFGEVLAFMVDNRPLTSTKASYSSLAAIINHRYAQRHRMDFKYIYVPGFKFQNRLLSGSKHQASCYNYVTERWRAAPWCKVPVAWFLVKFFAYEHFLFLDSDVVFQRHEKDLFKHLDNLPILYGDSWRRSPLIFLGDQPYSEQFNTGFFFLAKRNRVEDFLHGWWQSDNPWHDFNHDFEQTPGRLLMDEAKWKYFNFTVLDDAWFLADKRLPRFGDRLLLHVGSNDAGLRLPTFIRIINTSICRTEGCMKRKLAQVPVLTLDINSITLSMNVR